MGIYRTLLEEEVPHLDDNNNPDEQIKELQDVIDDHDANKAAQEDAQDAAFGPDGGVDEIMDESAMAIYEFEAGHAAIMQAMGMHELSEAAAGREFIMEGADIKGFFKSVKDKIVAFFKKVWSVLQRWAGNLTAMFTSNKKFVTKYASAMNDGHKVCSASGYTGKELKGYRFTNLKKSVDDIKGKANIEEKELALKNYISNIRTAIDNKTEVKDGLNAEKVEEILDVARGSFAGAGASGKISSADYGKELKKHLYGSEEPEKFWMEPSEVISILNDKKNMKKAVKDFMDEAKASQKRMLDSVSSMEKSATRMDDGSARNNIISECSRVVTIIRGTMTAAQTWRSATLGAINAQGRQARRYGMAYVAAANKGKYKGFQKESTEYGFLGNLGLV